MMIRERIPGQDSKNVGCQQRRTRPGFEELGVLTVRWGKVHSYAVDRTLTQQYLSASRVETSWKQLSTVNDD